MKTKQLREQTEQELRQQFGDSMDALVNLRVQAATTDPEDNRAIRRARRDIAKIKTLLREAELKREGKWRKKEREES